MKRFWGICAAGLLVGILALGFGVQAGAESEEGIDSADVSMEAVTDEELDEALANQPEDWHEWELTRAQEQALKMRLYRKGVLLFDAERTPEGQKQFKYLTRSVPIRSEAVPEGLVYNLMISFKRGTTDAEVQALLADLGTPKVVRELRREDHLLSAIYLHLDRNDITMDKKPDDIAEVLRRYDKEVLRERDPVTGLTRTKYEPPRHLCIASWSADPFTSRSFTVAKNLVCVQFDQELASKELHAFASRNRLTLGQEGNEETKFMTLRDVPIARSINALWNEPFVLIVRHMSGGGNLHIRGTLPRVEPSSETGWPKQWNFHQNRAAADTNYDTGNDSRDFDIDGAEGWWIWNQGSFTDSVIVAVIDDGFRIDHVDLISKWRRNPGEVIDGSDNDGNGYTDDEFGWDFKRNVGINSATTITGPSDSTWHGAAVAGVVGAQHDNSLCLAGNNWSASLIPIVAPHRADTLNLALRYARTEGANVINMSFGDLPQLVSTGDLIDSMYNEGVLFFAAAGDSNENESRADWPSDYDHVVMVGGTDVANRRYFSGSTDGSGWGEGVELSTPAEGLVILHDQYGPQSYAFPLNGNSFSCPTVSGLAGLLWSKYGPTTSGSDVEKIVRILKCAVNDIDGDVTNPTGGSSQPQNGRDDLGWGRPSLFEALAGPRVRKVSLTVGATRMFADGDRDGDGIFDFADWDLDGDGFDNETDENDDGDRDLDGEAGGADTDDDGDKLANGAEDSTNVLWKALGPCTLGLDLTFNESMGFSQIGFPSVSPQDPTVKLVLTNDTELTLSGNPGGDTDWPYIFEIEKDTWHGTVELDSAAAAQSAGDIRLRISGTVDMAGDTLDWDLATSGAQSYEYPLTMPGFFPSITDPNAGVIRNTTAQADSTWPLGWGLIFVNARNFNTDVSDPLAVRYMNIWIRDMDRDTVLVNGTSMLQSGRDFEKPWDTENDPYTDGRHEVTVKAYDLTRAQILTDYTRNIVIDNSPPIAQKLELRNIWPGDTGPDTTVIRKTEWVDHPTDPSLRKLEIETQRWMTLDTLEIVVQFDQTQDRDSLEIETSYMVQGGPTFPFNEVRFDSINSPDDTWVGRCDVVITSGMRDSYPGRWIITIKSADLAGNSIDAKAETKAYRDSLGVFVGYEDTQADSTHFWWQRSWSDIHIAGDVSQSLILGWNAQGMYCADRIIELAQNEHSDSSRADLYRASVWRFFGSTTTDEGIVEQLADLGGTLTQARSALGGLWAGASGWMLCSEQSAVIESLMSYTIGSGSGGSKSKPRNYVLVTDTQMNRGPSRSVQTQIWADAASDSSYGCATHLYTIMPEEYAEISDELGDIVSRSGGINAIAPSDSMFFRPTISRILFNLIRDNSRLYMAQAESARGTREDHWFHIDEIANSVFLIASWVITGLNLAPVELHCGADRQGSECDDCEEVAGKPGIAPLTREEAETGFKMLSVEEAKQRRDLAIKGGRASIQLYQPTGEEVQPTGILGSMAYWELTAPDTGQWRVSITGANRYNLQAACRGGVWIDLVGDRLIGRNAGTDILVRVSGPYDIQDPSWELIDRSGQAVGSLSLADDGSHNDRLSGDGIYGGSHPGFADGGTYRVRLTATIGGARIERVTREGVWVIAEPTIAFIEPDGVGDETGSNFTIRWTGESELSATLSLFYDNNNTGADGDTIATGLPVISGEDSLRWNVFGVEEGDYYLYAIVEEDAGVNPAQIVYSDHQVTVTTGAQENFPVSTGGRVRASPVAVDLEDNGSELELVIASEDSCLYIYDYQANLLPGFPLRLAEKLSSTPAVGNIDTLTTSLELVVGARDDSGTLYCVDHNAGSVSGWPVSLGSPIWSAPTLADLDTPPNGDLEVIVACGSQVHVRRSDGTVFPGWPQTIGCSSVLFTSPCVANYDPSDDELEIAVCGGTDTLYVFDATGSLEWKERVVGSFVWSPLASGDLDWDGSPEILVQTWHATQSRLYAFKGDGSAPSGWETPILVGLQARSGAALGDLDGDGRLEILIGDGNSGYVFGFASDGTALPGPWGLGIQIATKTYSPLCLADLDGNGSCEAIILGINNDKMNVVDQNGVVLESWSRALDGDCYGAPAIADIDLDGDTEILIGTDAGTVFCFDFGGTYSPLKMEYPKFQADLGNTGNYTEEIPPQPPTVETIEVVNGDELQLTWNTVSTDSLSRQELVTTYNVYRGSSAWFETGSLVGTVTMPETTYTDTTTGVVGDAGVNYAYEVTALDQHGNESRSSSRVGEHDFSSGGRARTDRMESVER